MAKVKGRSNALHKRIMKNRIAKRNNESFYLGDDSMQTHEAIHKASAIVRKYKENHIKSDQISLGVTPLNIKNKSTPKHEIGTYTSTKGLYEYTKSKMGVKNTSKGGNGGKCVFDT